MKKQPRNSKGRFARKARKAQSKRRKGGTFHAVRDASGRFAPAAPNGNGDAKKNTNAPKGQEGKVSMKNVIQNMKQMLSDASGIPVSQITSSVAALAPKKIKVDGIEVSGLGALDNPAEMTDIVAGKVQTPHGEGVGITSYKIGGKTVSFEW